MLTACLRKLVWLGLLIILCCIFKLTYSFLYCFGRSWQHNPFQLLVMLIFLFMMYHDVIYQYQFFIIIVYHSIWYVLVFLCESPQKTKEKHDLENRIAGKPRILTSSSLFLHPPPPPPRFALADSVDLLEVAQNMALPATGLTNVSVQQVLMFCLCYCLCYAR